MNSDIISIYQQSGWVLIGVLAVLVLMSVMTWIVALIRVAGLWRAGRDNRAVLAELEHMPVLQDACRHLDGNRAPIAQLTLDAVAAQNRYQDEANRQLAESLPLNHYLGSRIKNSIAAIVRLHESGLTVLASISASAPFIGLFGTVWGIYHALINISNSGQISIAAVAGPIGEALIATAVGLFAAIPALLFYNGLTRSKKNLARDLDRYAYDLHARLLNQHRQTQSNQE